MQTKQPKISIVMPVYNVAQFLPQALDSVINQTLKEIEIICVDDCSTDNSSEILEQYARKDNRIKVITQPENMGEVVAKYTAALNANAEYIGTVDPDDWAMPDMYETLYKYAVDNNARTVICNFNNVKENGEFVNEVKICENLIGENSINNDNIYKINPATTNKIIKKELYLNALNFTQRDIWKDLYQFWRCYIVQDVKTVFVNKALYNYRLRENSITHSKQSDEKIYKDFYQTVDKLLEYLFANNRYNQYSKCLQSIISANLPWIYYFRPRK